MTVTLRDYFQITYRQKFQASPDRATEQTYHWQLVIFENFFREFLRERGQADRPPTFDDLPPDEFGTDLVERAMQWQVLRGRSPVSANSLRAHLNALWNHAHKKRVAATCSANKAYAIDADVPIAFLSEEFDLVLQVADTLEGPLVEGSKVWARVWWGAIIRLGHCTMLRRKALMQVPTGNLDLVRNLITVSAKTQKQRQGQLLDLLDPTDTLLRELELRERRVPTVLGDFPFGPRALNAHFAKIVAAALGLEHVPPWLKWHALRRTGASEVISNEGYEAARVRLGHSSIETTKGYFDPRWDIHRKRIGTMMKARPIFAHRLKTFSADAG